MTVIKGEAANPKTLVQARAMRTARTCVGPGAAAGGMKRVTETRREKPRGARNGTQAGGDVRLSPVERVLVSALVSAIVKELRAAQSPRRQPAA
jgi:hypothetical protein